MTQRKIHRFEVIWSVLDKCFAVDEEGFDGECIVEDGHDPRPLNEDGDEAAEDFRLVKTLRFALKVATALAETNSEKAAMEALYPIGSTLYWSSNVKPKYQPRPFIGKVLRHQWYSGGLGEGVMLETKDGVVFYPYTTLAKIARTEFDK